MDRIVGYRLLIAMALATRQLRYPSALVCEVN